MPLPTTSRLSPWSQSGSICSFLLGDRQGGAGRGRFSVVLRGDVNRIVVGRGGNIQDPTVGHVSHKTAAKPEGSPLTIGHSVIFPA